MNEARVRNRAFLVQAELLDLMLRIVPSGQKSKITVKPHFPVDIGCGTCDDHPMFTVGDMATGQSLVVGAIAGGRCYHPGISPLSQLGSKRRVRLVCPG